MTTLDPVPSSNRHFPPERLLNGNLVSSPHHLRNLEGRAGVYFLFPDVSVLMRLSRVDATGMVSVGESGSMLAQTRTQTFDVTPRHTYVAPLEYWMTSHKPRSYGALNRAINLDESALRHQQHGSVQ